MIKLYVASVVGAITISMGGYIWYQNTQIKTLKARQTELVFAVESCDNRIQNLLEDLKSDTEIDNTPDNNLGDLVRPEWLLPPG